VTFDFEAGGVARQVETRGTEMVLDGRPVEVDAVRAGLGWSLLIGRRSYEVSLVQRGPGDLVVHVNGRAVAVTGGPRRHGVRRDPAAGHAGATGGRTHRVVAPMPGRVARVLVRAGEAVQVRQGLVVVEAMKMENELRSPRAGIVSEVRAVEGALVDANAVLVVIET
jgi:biotin carboxyl carrier protein